MVLIMLQGVGFFTVVDWIGRWFARNSPTPPITNTKVKDGRRIGTIVSIVATRPNDECETIDVWNHVTVTNEKNDDEAIIEANLNYAVTEKAIEGYEVTLTMTSPLNLK
jgi:hypothetical protein